MGKVSDRIKGKAEQVRGAFTTAVGKSIGDERLAAEGAAAERRGAAREAAAKASERMKGRRQQLAGNIKQVVGKVLGNEQMQLEGKAKQLEGQARKKLNE